MSGPAPVTGPLPAGTHPAAAPSATTVITGAGLAKRFGTTVALDGVDVAVGAGESLAIMGPSGSGKSTLLHCLAGILRPDAGAVTLLGTRIDTLNENRRSELRRTRFGFVFQFGQLLPELPADENVALPLMLDGMTAGRAVAQARTWFGPLGLGGMERRRPGELSGGQAQRVALARALVTGPSVIFADEPTGSLDQATGHETMRLLVEAARHHGASLILVTHDPQVAAWCTRIVEVRDGHLLGDPPASPPGPPGDGPSRASSGSVPGRPDGGPHDVPVPGPSGAAAPGGAPRDVPGGRSGPYGWGPGPGGDAA